MIDNILLSAVAVFQNHIWVNVTGILFFSLYVKNFTVSYLTQMSLEAL